MIQKPSALDHHHNLGIFLLILMLATLPLFLWALNHPRELRIRAYFPPNCEVPRIPRDEVCPQGWEIGRNESGCRVFVCNDLATTP